VPASSGVEELESAKYLFLREISEPRDNSLRLVVQEAVVSNSEAIALDFEGPELAEIRKGASPIESTEDCRSFELYWKRYVAYLVTEECVGSGGRYDDEVFSGRLFRVYSKSHFLEHLKRDTGGHIETFQHYKIVCLNHLVDVVADGLPEIRVLNRRPSKPARIQ